MTWRKFLYTPALIFALALTWLAFVPGAQAASEYLSPASGTFAPGADFSTTVFVDSSDQEMNAVSGVIVFDTNVLEVTSVSTGGSIIAFWVNEPAFSNSAGTVRYEGVRFTPGFQGSAGKILTINFRAKAAAETSVQFTSGSVLANDGSGTNILSALGNAAYSIVGSTETVPDVVEVPAITTTEGVIDSSINTAPDAPTLEDVLAGDEGAPAAPVITSATHPEEGQWYNISSPEFAWELTGDTTRVQLLFGLLERAVPNVTYVPPISNRTLENLEDGEYYFHVRLGSRLGWGETAHYYFRVDTVAPTDVAVDFVPQDEDQPFAELTLSAIDELSGLDFYEVQIDDGDVLDWTLEESNYYTTPLLSAGSHAIRVVAVDRAGNRAEPIESSFVVTFEETPIVIGTPVIDEIGEEHASAGAFFDYLTNSWFSTLGDRIVSLIVVSQFLVIIILLAFLWAGHKSMQHLIITCSPHEHEDVKKKLKAHKAKKRAKRVVKKTGAKRK